MKMGTLRCVLIIGLCLVGVESANILMVVYFGSKSHMSMLNPLAKGLAKRGHQVTVMTPYPKSEDVEGIHVVNPSAVVKELAIVMENFQKRQPPNVVAVITDFFGFANDMCEAFLGSPETKEIMKSKYDLVLIDALQNDCAVGLAHRLNAPFGYLSTGSLIGWYGMALRNPQPTSILPSLFSQYTGTMTFWQRLHNLAIDSLSCALRVYYALPAEDAMMRRHLGDDLPPMEEMERNVSLVLINQHFSLELPRAYLPGMVEVGGMQCRAAKPLPESLATFVEGGEEGFIYLSFGTVVLGSKMDPKLRDAFLGAFAKLKLRVLWKWETETMEGIDVPKNVKLSKWLPQQDILGHPKCRAFITHGGTFGQQESIYHGVPVLVMPFFADQDTNANRAVDRGYGLKMDPTQATDQDLLRTIHQLITETKFRQNMKALSTIYRDQPDAPLDRAIFWTEYAIRHKGAPHMRSSARQMPLYQFYQIDVITFTIVAVILTLAIVYIVLRKVFQIVCGTRNKQKRD